MNYRENIVYNDLKGIGYEVSRCEEKGYPDFRVFSFNTGERFYVEIKSRNSKWDSQIQYNNQQKETFKKLTEEGILVLIAIPENGMLEYKNFPDMSLWRKISYGTANYDVPEYICKRCGHRWIPRKKDKPVRCPRCMSPYWDKEKKGELRKWIT